MTERPILFSAPMVRAILEGRKTQTRRVIKPQFSELWGYGVKNGDDRFSCHVNILLPDGNWTWIYCPYGMKGDRLWVKETFGVCENIAANEDDTPNFRDRDGVYHPIVHFADKENFAWGMYGPPTKRSSLFMPRSAARLWLEIVNIRVERVQNISRKDATAEGMPEQFQSLWDEINGKRGYGWDVNPWVWVIEFRRI